MRLHRNKGKNIARKTLRKKRVSNEKRKKTRKTTHQMVQVPNAYLTHPIGKKKRTLFSAHDDFLFLET
jgi:hypothetical protein